MIGYFCLRFIHSDQSNGIKKTQLYILGVVSAVHSQSFCASCWAFSAVGAIEAAFAIQVRFLDFLRMYERYMKKNQ